MAGTIFINYRRDDSIGTAGRLHDRLAQTFGRKNLFMDVDHIPAGVDFIEYLNSQVAACDVFLAIIGPNWLDAKDDDGRRRFDNPDDFVTIEIAAALARSIRVIPVLVDGARAPKADKLPDSVKALVRRNAVEVRNTHFGRDAEALVNKVHDALKSARPTAGWLPFMAAQAWLMVPRRWRMVGSVIALLFVGWIGLYSLGVSVWAPWPDSPSADKARTAADAEARLKADEAEQQRLKQEVERQARVAADAEAKREAAEAEQQRLKQEVERQARVAADAEAKLKAAEAEQQRLIGIKEEAQRQTKAAADAEAKRKAAEAEQQRLKDELQRLAKAAADVETKRKAAEAEQQRLANVKAEEDRKTAAASTDTAAQFTIRSDTAASGYPANYESAARSAQECQLMCARSATCKIFTFDNKTARCYVYSTADDVVYWPNKNYIAGIRK
jgi:TIR domain/PAN domain